eukprot:CAMPEP_0195579036 /NCGR_PEP_ID=MMETSP0814-20130614/13180_1 /TAXON_ID=97485 /ORGANISM="Prymnesium parvum, Strain Texoma1" /LENGTH=334 /DNA_ID=CAMNT_0040715673 /DNA_START=107 /DNA_END=1107 /DNA_ORIENTATION=+
MGVLLPAQRPCEERAVWRSSVVGGATLRRPNNCPCPFVIVSGRFREGGEAESCSASGEAQHDRPAQARRTAASFVAAASSAALCGARTQVLESGDHHLQRDRVEASGDDHVGVALARLDELIVHRPDGIEVLADHRAHLAATLADVALQPADEADIRVRVDEDLDVEHVSQLLVRVDQNALDEYDARGVHHRRRRAARVRGEVVHRDAHRRAALELAQMLHQQRCLQRVRVVEVGACSDLHRQVVERAVVRVVRDVHEALGTDALRDGAGDGGLARAGAAGDPHDHRPIHVVEQLVPVRLRAGALWRAALEAEQRGVGRLGRVLVRVEDRVEDV